MWLPVEKNTYPKGKACGNQIFANSLELFRKMDDD
jgi:hypothetical protein